jgi:hypothetical protein
MKAFIEQYIGPILYWGIFAPIGFIAALFQPILGEWLSIIVALVIYGMVWDFLITPGLKALLGPVLGPVFRPFTRIFASIDDVGEKYVNQVAAWLCRRMGLPTDHLMRERREYDPHFDPPEEEPHPEQPAPAQPHFEFGNFTVDTTENHHG